MGKFYGNQHTEHTPEWNYEDILEGAKSFAEEHGETPTTEDAAEDDRFPCLATVYDNLDGSWNDLLEDAGLERGHVGTYGPEEESAMLQDLRAVQQSLDSDYLTTRAYEEHGEYGKETIKERFGSWSDACELARIDAGTKFGNRCEGPEGNVLDSLQELKVAQMLYGRGLDYEAHPKLNGTTWVGDFYIPAYDLWVEVDGFSNGERPNKADFERKVEHYEEHEMELVIVENPIELGEELQRRLKGD